MSAGTNMKATIEDVAWLVGSRSCEIWDGVFEEHWAPPAKGTMQGIGRHIKADGIFMEFFAIEPSEDGLTLWIMLGAPSKGDKKPIPFALTQLSPTEVTFENKERDYPAKLIYTNIGPGRIDCVLTGTKDGATKRDEFNFRAMS